MNKSNNFDRRTWLSPRILVEFISIIVICTFTYLLATHYDILELILQFSSQHESWEVDEIMTVLIVLSLLLTVFCGNRLRELGIIRKDLAIHNRDLQAALAELSLSRQTLEQSQEQTHLLLNSTAEAIYGLDLQGSCTFCNQACVEMLGFPSDDVLLGKNILELISHRGDSGTTNHGEESRIHESFRKGIPIHSESEIFWRADGTSFPVEYWSHPVIQNGSVTGAVVTFLDISWRKEVERELAQREREYRTLLENSPALIIRYDTDLRRLYVNPAWERTLALSADKAIHRTIFDKPTCPPHMIEDYAGWLRHVLDTGTTQKKEFPWINARGEQLFLEYIIAPEFGPDGEILSLLAVGMDITKRKKSEKEQERLLQAIEQAGEMFIITDPNGIIQYINPAFEKITGFSRENAVGESMRLLKSGKQDDLFYRHLWETISRGDSFHGRLVNKRKDGTLFTVDITISPVRSDSGEIINYVAVQHDLSDYLQLEAQFRQAQKMESVGRLAGGVAHDFNNMLSVIIGYTQLCMRQEKMNKPIDSSLEEILKAAQRSAALTQQLLGYARKQTISPITLDLNETVENMLKMLHKMIGEDIDLSWRPSPGLCPVKMDPSQLDQILANLCVNARDAISGVGKISIETGTVTVDDAYCTGHPEFIPGQYVLLAVSDDGCGMDKNTLSNIFEPFFTTKENTKGTGLGLAMVYGIVKQNKGFINVYSEPAGGTTIRIYLPTHEEGIEASRSKKQRTAGIPRGKGETILIVDDDQALMKLGESILTNLNYQVFVADTSEKAKRIAEEYADSVHLLLTDVIMPEMNGHDLANQLQSLYSELKVLYMSGYTADIIAHRGALKDGVNFIQKPFSIETLASKVREVLTDS